MCGGELNSDAGCAFRHDGEEEADDVDAFLEEAVRHVLG